MIDTRPAREYSTEELLRLVASLEQNSEHPLAAAIVRGAKKRNIALSPVVDFRSVTGGGVAGKIDDPTILVGKPDFLRNEGIHEVAAFESSAVEFQNDGKTALFVAIDGKAAGIPIAAAVLYPITGTLLSPIIAGAAMSLSSVSVISNALRLRNLQLH